jgi:hypothetical protein
VATAPSGAGFLTVFPCGAGYPTSTSTVNFLTGADAAYLAVIPTGAGGRICLYSMTTTHVVIDVLGSFGPVGALRSLSVSAGGLVRRSHPMATTTASSVRRAPTPGRSRRRRRPARGWWCGTPTSARR